MNSSSYESHFPPVEVGVGPCQDLQVLYWHQLVAAIPQPSPLLTIPTHPKRRWRWPEAGWYTCKHHTEFVTNASQLLHHWELLHLIKSPGCTGDGRRCGSGMFFSSWSIITRTQSNIVCRARVSGAPWWVFIMLSDYCEPMSETKQNVTTCSNSDLHWIVILTGLSTRART